MHFYNALLQLTGLACLCECFAVFLCSLLLVEIFSKRHHVLVCSLGSQVLVNDKLHRWSRATVIHLSQIGMDDVTSCLAQLLTSASLFLLDHGVTRTVSLDMCVHARTHSHRHCYGYRFRNPLGLPTARMFTIMVL